MQKLWPGKHGSLGERIVATYGAPCGENTSNISIFDTNNVSGDLVSGVALRLYNNIHSESRRW